MKTATWGWNPPYYQRYESGKYMIIYNPVQFEETITRKDHETEEETTETITRWTVWYEEMELPQVTEAINNEDTITANRLLLTEIINLYDVSPAVNEFTIGGISVWLDKNTRAGLKLRFEAEIASGETETTLWYNGMSFNLQLEQAVQMLYAIELYASKCYDVTQQHLANIQNLTVELENYDYQSGYPEKLAF